MRSRGRRLASPGWTDRTLANLPDPLGQRRGKRIGEPALTATDRPIAFDVGQISAEAINLALDAAAAMADNLLQAGLIEGAVLVLRGRLRVRHRSLTLQEVA